MVICQSAVLINRRAEPPCIWGLSAGVRVPARPTQPLPTQPLLTKPLPPAQLEPLLPTEAEPLPPPGSDTAQQKQQQTPPEEPPLTAKESLLQRSTHSLSSTEQDTYL